MKIGVNALIWTAGFGLQDLPLLRFAAEQGFDSFEIPLFDPAGIPIRELRAELDSLALDRTVCAILPQDLNPISSEASTRVRALDHLRRCVETTAQLGANLMAGPLYAPVGYLTGTRRITDEWTRAVECFQSLAPTLDGCGVSLALEPLNRFEAFFLTTAAEAALFCQAVSHPRVGVLLDTFHTNIEEKDVAGAFRTLGSQLFHVHASENDRGIPGTGHVPFPAIFAALSEIQYTGRVTIESFGYTHPALARATAIWRDLAPSPQAIAIEGLRYLRSL
jgi:D-psicose/D-tagatose/L-ribulose 3-epimerase